MSLHRILLSTLNLVCLIQFWILSLIYRKKPASIPPITNSLYTLSATDLAKKIRQREITSYEVVTAYIERIKAVNPYINAVIENRFEAALNEAKTCDEQLKLRKFDAETLQKEKPLFGIPFTAKECCSVEGLSFTGCSLARAGIKATEDGIAVAQLRNAGAIPLCVTNMSEMCLGPDSTNRMFGRTRNPYDTRYTAGGSSGGEGALVGAGASLIGIGSDLGGSVRIPAHMNGVFGHKPTAGIIPNQGHLPSFKNENLERFLTTGTLTRYAEDLSLVMRVLTSGYDCDLRLDMPVDLRHLKIYYRESMDQIIGLMSVAPEIERCILKATEHFSQYGVHIERLPIKWPREMYEIMLSAYSAKDVPPLLLDVRDPKLRKNVRVELAKAIFGMSQHEKLAILLMSTFEQRILLLKTDASHYMRKRESTRKDLLDLLGENGVFIYPTFRIPATFPECMICEPWNSIPYTAFINICGFPSTHVPMGLNRDGLPIGFQVIAAPHQDRLCLAVAKELERAFGGWIPPSISMDG